jgi:hypothetical protein
MTNIKVAQEGNFWEKNWERIALFVFGFVFLVLTLVVVISATALDSYQQRIVSVMVALAGAGVGALVPGILEIKYKTLVRATGAFGVFVASLYFLYPDGGEGRLQASRGARNRMDFWGIFQSNSG